MVHEYRVTVDGKQPFPETDSREKRGRGKTEGGSLGGSCPSRSGQKKFLIKKSDNIASAECWGSQRSGATMGVFSTGQERNQHAG